MKIPVKTTLVCIFSIILSTGISGAQDNVVNDSTVQEKEIIEASEIAREATLLTTSLLDMSQYLIASGQKSEYKTYSDTLHFKLNLQREDPRLNRLESLSIRELNNLNNEWQILNSRFSALQTELTETIRNNEEQKKTLEALITKWQNTKEYLEDSDASNSVIEQVSPSINRIGDLLDRFKTDNDFMQEILAKVSESMISINETLNQIQTANSEAKRNLFQINKAPVWKLFKSRTERAILVTQRSFVDDTRAMLVDFASAELIKIILHIILSVLIIVFIYFFFNNLKHAIPEENIPEIDTIKQIIKRPLSSAFLIIFLIPYFMYENIPETLNFINLILILIPVLFILHDILPRKTRKYIWLPLIATILMQLQALFYRNEFVSRLMLLLIIAFGIVSLVWIIRNWGIKSYTITKWVGKLLFFLSLVGLVLMSVSFIAALGGAVLLSEFLTFASIRSAALILIFYALNRTLESIIYTTVYSETLRRVNIIAQEHNKIYRVTKRIVILLSWTVWAIFALNIFAVWDNVSAALGSLIIHDISVGSVSITLGNILVFIFLIWFTLWLSRASRIVFESEIASRIRMKRGVPGAISLIMRILIITIGFLLAIGAAGVEMDKLAILLGALGVGIGFGLQNIFNNLISGLILAFERPIQEGDIIEVGEFWGTVKEIGIRASTIFTFDGAEVIVPNGNLISSEVINWTLTDQNRRVEVLVGVAYGTDPGKVLQILNEVVTDEEDILREPAPLALFTGFGESSLDFRLLFWIPKAENRFVIQSNVNVAVNNAIKEAGIEIPFPQRDLHLRSVDGSVLSGLDRDKK